VARHIASHAVTVTECDAVPRASRHIRPPIRGGVHVTRDAQGAKEGWKRPRHCQACVDIEQQAFRAISARTTARSPARVIQRVFLPARYRRPSNSKANPRPSYGLAAGPHFPFASRLAIRRYCPSHNLLQDNKTPQQHHLSGDQRGIYARSLSRPSTLLKDARATHCQAKRKGMLRIETKKTRVGVGVPPNKGARPSLDLLPLFRGRSSEIGAAFIPKTLNLLPFLAAAGLENSGCGHE
jgi:hypothetical protein